MRVFPFLLILFFCFSSSQAQTDTTNSSKDKKKPKTEAAKTKCDSCNSEALKKEAVLILAKYRNTKEKLFSEYNCSNKSTPMKAVQEEVLKENLYGIYQVVIPSTQAAGGDGSAFTYSKDDKKDKFSVAATFPWKKESFVNVDIATETTGGVSGLYSSGAWQKDVSFSLGYSKVVGGSSQFFSDSNCTNSNSKREMFVDSLLLEYAKILSLDSCTIAKKIDEIDTKKKGSEEFYSLLYTYKGLKDGDSPQKDLIRCKMECLKKKYSFNETEIDTTNYQEQLDKLNKKLNEYNELKEAIDKEEGKSLLTAKLTEFDKKIKIMYGYRVHWIFFGGSVSNTSINIEDTDTTDGKTTYSKKHPTFTLTAGYKCSQLGAKALQYLSVWVEGKRGSFLDDPSLDSDPSISPQNNTSYVVSDEKTLGKFDDVVKPVYQCTLAAYYASFFLFNKSFGISLKASGNWGDRKNAPGYKSNFSVMFGPIFRSVKEESFAKATFGISVGLFNALNLPDYDDAFSVQAYAGLPFNALIGKK